MYPMLSHILCPFIPLLPYGEALIFALTHCPKAIPVFQYSAQSLRWGSITLVQELPERRQNKKRRAIRIRVYEIDDAHAAPAISYLGMGTTFRAMFTIGPAPPLPRLHTITCLPEPPKFFSSTVARFETSKVCEIIPWLPLAFLWFAEVLIVLTLLVSVGLAGEPPDNSSRIASDNNVITQV